tara:strand:+ start:30613 stop:30837 length:225 start_codon:yes stop_codon:yes gene_type:complete
MSCEIQSVNQRLNLHQAKFKLTAGQSTAAFQKLNPYLIIGVGFFVGVVTNIVGWRKVYTFSSVGFSLYPFLINK